MQALIMKQPFKLHPRFIAIFEDSFDPDKIKTWLVKNRHKLQPSMADAQVVLYEHTMIDFSKLIHYTLITNEGIMELHLVTVKANELCEVK